jgi:hypothetical protein
VGLDLAISDTGTYGNIPRTSDYEWWKAGVDSVAHTTDNMKNSLHASYLLTLLANGFAFTNRANEHFDLLLMRQETWDTYENIIQTLGLTINSSSSKIVKQMADAGFQAFEWRGIMMVVDNFIDSVEKPMYGVNTNYLTLYVHPQNNFIMTPFKESQDQPHTKVAQITAKLGLAISNPSHFYRWSNLNN